MQSKIIKMDSGVLIKNLQKRGFIIGEVNKDILYNIEKTYKEKGGDRQSIASQYNIDRTLKKMIKIFSVLDRYNINYIHYIIILISIENSKLNNLYRYIMVKWNSLISKINNSKKCEVSQIEKMNSFRFIPLKNIEEKKVLEEILKRFEEFVFLDNHKFPNIYILFLVNNIQEYLCPI